MRCGCRIFRSSFLFSLSLLNTTNIALCSLSSPDQAMKWQDYMARLSETGFQPKEID